MYYIRHFLNRYEEKEKLIGRVYMRQANPLNRIMIGAIKSSPLKRDNFITPRKVCKFNKMDFKFAFQI